MGTYLERAIMKDQSIVKVVSMVAFLSVVAVMFFTSAVAVTATETAGNQPRIVDMNPVPAEYRLREGSTAVYRVAYLKYNTDDGQQEQRYRLEGLVSVLCTAASNGLFTVKVSTKVLFNRVVCVGGRGKRKAWVMLHR
jgi:hypothetical protein